MRFFLNILPKDGGGRGGGLSEINSFFGIFCRKGGFCQKKTEKFSEFLVKSLSEKTGVVKLSILLLSER